MDRPAERMKGKREHRVPLPRRCLKILDRGARLSDGGPYIFPGGKPQAPLSDLAFLELLRRMERTDCVPHGFRSTFRDWTAERTNFPRAVVEAALAHAIKDKSEAAYFRSDLLEPRRPLMDVWCRFAQGTPAQVVAIHGERSS